MRLTDRTYCIYVLIYRWLCVRLFLHSELQPAKTPGQTWAKKNKKTRELEPATAYVSNSKKWREKLCRKSNFKVARLIPHKLLQCPRKTRPRDILSPSMPLLCHKLAAKTRKTSKTAFCAQTTKGSMKVSCVLII